MLIVLSCLLYIQIFPLEIQVKEGYTIHEIICNLDLKYTNVLVIT